MSSTVGIDSFAAAFTANQGATTPGLIPYLTAGYPRRDDTAALMGSAEQAGALAIEVGIPFSDPLADGPTIQRTSHRALVNGMNLRLALAQVAAARESGLRVPVAVMTYINVVLAHGVEAFAADAAAAGVDGVIVPDLPWSEAGSVRVATAAAGLAYIPLVTPLTTEERLDALCAAATGFVYCVSVAGTTGARTSIAEEAFDLLDRVAARTPTPRALGFGVSTAEQVRALSARADAVVVGSALLDAVAAAEDPVAAVGDFLRGLRRR